MITKQISRYLSLLTLITKVLTSIQENIGGDFLPGVAINGSKINESIKSGHVTYSIKQLIPGHYTGYDPETGDGYGWVDDKWVPAGSGSTGARITGSVVISSSKMKITGSNVATVGDTTNETWEAYPPIPSSTTTTIYTATSATSGQGQGKIISGSSKGNLQGNPIALIGSQVRTCLETITTIKTGNEKLKFGS